MSPLELLKHKIVDLHQLQQLRSDWKEHGLKVVFTNGVFDLLHLGHVDYLAKTAHCGDRLIIALNSDASVKTLSKGPARPIKDEITRAHLLAAFSFVDAVLIFGEPTPKEVVHVLTPDVLVKGGDYDAQETDSTKKKYIVGSDWVKKHGGKVEVIPFVPGHSTTALEQKIIDAHNQ